MTRTIIQVKNLTTHFGTQVVHDNLNFDVHENEIISIVGASGSGKSVLFNFLTGLEDVQTGEIIYDHNMTENYGILFQMGGLLSSLTVIENVMFPLIETKKIPQNKAYAKAKTTLERVELTKNDFEKYPSQLSGGMVKRVGLARALANEPRLLFLDEPTSGLDPISADDFDEMIVELKKEMGLTCVMITHDLYSILNVSDRIAVLVDKKIIEGTVDEIVHYKHPWIHKYFNGKRARECLGKKTDER